MELTLDLNKLNAEELAALYIALRRQLSSNDLIAIVGAGEANCGATIFRQMTIEVSFCHDSR
jgi:hypothetical protein